MSEGGENRRLSHALLFAGCAAFLSCVLVSCGARTDLPGASVCHQEGEVQACVRGCAEGTMQCSQGFWSDCVTVPHSRSCENSCGVGVQHCSSETWGPCEVPPVTASCQNVCGTGTQTCVDDEWSVCAVAPVTETCSFGCGDGMRSCTDNVWSACDAPVPTSSVMQVTVRDFLKSHPDMERNNWDGVDWGIVAPILGPDRTPVYMGGPDGTSSTSGEAAFYQWYHDSDVSMKTTVSLPLTPMPGSTEFYQYRGRPFFPIDDQLFGNEGNEHNFYFTLEAHEDFIYQEDQQFTFQGDDDTWVFINNRLAIDLGGTHQTASATIKLTPRAEELGLVLGQTYPIDIFFAERHTLDSNFVIRTSITGLGQCPE